MFTQQKLLFQFTKAIALVILLCFTFSYQAQGDEAVKEKANDMAEITAQIEFYEKEFEKDIKERLFVELKKEFKEPRPRFDKMADLLGDNAVLATAQGERLKGKDSLSRFWRKEKERGIIDVDFTLKYHYVSEIADPIEQPDPQDTIDAVGHAIIEYHLINPKEGGTLTNQTGTLTLSLRHPRSCVWEE
ncbi:MAG: hypothetical protein KAV87_65415 [Desulfobacteraceae bacterium]|nr:hypothetical protein [Desulfobacteraceae bacterium]